MDQMDLSSVDKMDLSSMDETMDQMDLSSGLPSPQEGRSALIGLMTDVSSSIPLAQVGPAGGVATVVGLLVSIVRFSWSNHSRPSSYGY